MNIKLILIIGFTYAYAFFELLMGLKRKRRNKTQSHSDRWSIWVMGIMISIGYSLAFAIGSTKIGRIYPWNTFFTIGILMIAFGLYIRIRSLLTLKQYFSYTVQKVEGHQLIESGIYQYIRHPGYLGQIILFVGLAISLSNWLAALSMFISVFIGYSYRIQVEEKFMIEQFGEKYIQYKKRTKRFIPFLY